MAGNDQTQPDRSSIFIAAGTSTVSPNLWLHAEKPQALDAMLKAESGNQFGPGVPPVAAMTEKRSENIIFSGCTWENWPKPQENGEKREAA